MGFFFMEKNPTPRTHNWQGWPETRSWTSPPPWTIKERQALGLDSGMPGGIWKNKEKTKVKIISHTLQPANQ